MKKFIVIALMLLGFVSNASAVTPAYYWDILGVASSQAIDSNGYLRAYEWDDVEGGTYSTSWNHGGTVHTVIAVIGYSNGAPVTTFNNSSMQLRDVDPIYNQSGTAIGWFYYYVSSGYNGNIEIKDWSGGSYGTRDRVFVK